jgi:hypothetical protein
MPLTRPGRAKALARVERAVVQFSRKGGRGILVPGGLILTAAHCVNWSLEGDMVLGDDYLEKVQTADGEELLLSVLAIEPVADVAVLGAPDNQRLLEQAIAFDEFTARTKPAALFRGAPQRYRFARVRTATNDWRPSRRESISSACWPPTRLPDSCHRQQ